MPVQCLVRAQPVVPARVGKVNVGYVVDVRDVADLPGRPWGGSEVPPEYTLVEVPDATVPDIQVPWMQFKYNEFQYELVRTTATDERWLISVPTSLVQQYGQKAFPLELEQYMIDTWNAPIFNAQFSQGRARWDFPAPVDIAAIQADLKDLWEVFLDLRRYRINDATINQSLANGGIISKTLAEFEAAMQDTIT